MSIRRAARKPGKFTVIDNVVFNSGLSFRAMGMLTYLLSKPDHWEVSVTQLVKHAKGTAKPDGRDAIYAILAELIDKRFVERHAIRNSLGQSAGTEYIVHDSPLPPEPLTDKPETAQPDTAKPTQVNTDVEVNTETPVNTDNTHTSTDADECAMDAAFEHFWSAGMVKTGKKPARQKFAKLAAKQKDPMAFAEQLAADVRQRIAAGVFGFAKLHPITYLNQERWNDEIVPAENKPRGQYNGLDSWTEDGLQNQGGRTTL